MNSFMMLKRTILDDLLIEIFIIEHSGLKTAAYPTLP